MGGALLVIVIGGVVFLQKVSAPTVPAAVTENASSEVASTTTIAEPTGTPVAPKPVSGGAPAPAPAAGITSAEVASHNSRQSCWSIINGNVYDLTSWIPEHPGGEQAILKLCGTDGSVKFNGKHGGAPKQAAVLFGFKIGAAL